MAPRAVNTLDEQPNATDAGVTNAKRSGLISSSRVFSILRHNHPQLMMIVAMHLDTLEPREVELPDKSHDGISHFNLVDPFEQVGRKTVTFEQSTIPSMSCGTSYFPSSREDHLLQMSSGLAVGYGLQASMYS